MKIFQKPNYFILLYLSSTETDIYFAYTVFSLLKTKNVISIFPKMNDVYLGWQQGEVFF